MFLRSLLPQWLSSRNDSLKGPAQTATDSDNIADRKPVHHDQILMLGGPQVGKSTLVQLWCRGNDSISLHAKYFPTIGIEFSYYHKQADVFDINAEVWDISGNDQRYAPLTMMAPRMTGAFLVYDVTRRESFVNVRNWLAKLEVLERRKLTVVTLLANKIDLVAERVISAEEGREFARLNGLHFMEVSSMETSNVKEVMEQELSLIHDFYKFQHPFKTDWSNRGDHDQSSRDYHPLMPELDSLARIPFYASYL